ncbi:DNA modification methylase [Candidatus Kaiserbacteria bacterium]|nr:DNA modification methylase [Candidatus Kaiserbacteria bacterium]
MQTTQLTWHTEERKVDALLPHKKTPRKISKEQADRLKQSLETYGLVEIPAVDLDGTILAGHQRIKALQLLGRGNEQIDVRVPNRKLTEKEAEAYMIGSNSITGEWDFDLLKNFEMDLLADLGFDQKELDDIWNKSLKKDFDPEKELKKIKKATTQPGDIIELGKHRLICGDSLKQETLVRLFGDERADMIMSDPIYNISIDYNKGIGGKQAYGGTVDDSKSDSEYKEFLKASMEAGLAVTKPDAHVFYWSDETYIWLIQTLYRELGIKNKRVCLWLKNGQNPTPGVVFNKCYEPCTYGTRGKPKLVKGVNKLNEVLNAEMTTGNELIQQVTDFFTIWPEARLSSKEYEHSTMKPVALYEKAIRRCTKAGDIILDSFNGSGSNLMAAEKLGRRVFAVEIEPIFCDLTIKRFEAETGLKAKVIRHEKALQGKQVS